MFKVMIVDDEVLIISLIQNIVDWEKYHMKVVGTAENGITALTELERLKPDIVIVDVRMPGYDGITFMQKVREINSKIKFIVISGHKNFEYAKSAMKYNVEDYVIKPISKDELEEILFKLEMKLKEERLYDDRQKNLSAELTVRQSKIQEYFIDSFLKSKIEPMEFNEALINHTYFTKFSAGNYRGIVIKMDSSYTPLDLGFVEKIMRLVEDKFTNSIQPLCHQLVTHTRGSFLYALCNYKNSVDNEFIDRVKEVSVLMREELQKFEEIFLTAGVGNKCDNLLEGRDSLFEAISSIKARSALGTDRIILFSDRKEDSGVINIVLSDSVLEVWDRVIRSLQIDRIKLQLLTILNHADEYKYQDSLIYDKVLRILNRRFYEYIMKIDLCKKSYDEYNSEMEEAQQWALNSRMMTEAGIGQISQYILYFNSGNTKEVNPAIRIVKRYIAENYQKNITLAAMAELVSLSSVYFSVLFKREVGINFLDYLNQYRLQASKELLKQVKYNVNEAANLSGFSDAKYFSKLFKRTFGITPTEYKSRNAV